MSVVEGKFAHMANVVITGASRGLGRALAREFAGRGHRVFGGTRSDTDLGEGIEQFKLDVRDEVQVDHAVDHVGSLGSIDILINNAGIYLGGPLDRITQDEFKHVLDVNLLGAWRVTRAALRYMQAGGVIAMVSSLSGLVGLAGDGPYAASKFALEGMSQSLADELAARSIRVVVAEPGTIRTGFAGVSRGVEACEIAREIADIVADPGGNLQYPVGDQARLVAEKIGLDPRLPCARLLGRTGE